VELGEGEEGGARSRSCSGAVGGGSTLRHGSAGTMPVW
jgi:hypothetical protein